MYLELGVSLSGSRMVRTRSKCYGSMIQKALLALLDLDETDESKTMGVPGCYHYLMWTGRGVSISSIASFWTYLVSRLGSQQK